MNKNVLILFLSSLLLFGTHFIINSFVLTDYKINLLYQIYVFLGVITILFVFVLEKIRLKNEQRFGQAYLISVVLKMFSSIVFLFPKILGDNQNEKLFVVHFFIAFFIYLILEVYLLVSSLKK